MNIHTLLYIHRSVIAYSLQRSSMKLQSRFSEVFDLNELASYANLWARQNWVVFINAIALTRLLWVWHYA